MVRYKKNDARAWARDNMKGVANVVIPSFSRDLKRLNEKGIRFDIRKEIEYGFWGTLLVSEVAITVDEYTQFVKWSHDEAGGKLKLIHHAGFGTLKQNIAAVQAADKAGAGWCLQRATVCLSDATNSSQLGQAPRCLRNSLHNVPGNSSSM